MTLRETRWKNRIALDQDLREIIEPMSKLQKKSLSQTVNSMLRAFLTEI